MISLKNDLLEARFASLGAELKSVVDRKKNYEFMWQADPAVWGRTAPVLFPVVGKLRNDQLLVSGNSYPLSQHGFARDLEFTVLESGKDQVSFGLGSSRATKAVYPYDFDLIISYTLEKNTVSCNWKVLNKGEEEMWFGIGAHPGFNLPSGKMSDYVLEFSAMESSVRHLLDGGLLNGRQEYLLDHTNRLKLGKELFDRDAIVLKDLVSERIRLKSADEAFVVDMRWTGFPALGVWSKKDNEQFICLEPWCGYADPVEGHSDISAKPGMNRLLPEQVFERTYSMTFTI